METLIAVLVGAVLGYMIRSGIAALSKAAEKVDAAIADIDVPDDVIEDHR